MLNCGNMLNYDRVLGNWWILAKNFPCLKVCAVKMSDDYLFFKFNFGTTIFGEKDFITNINTHWHYFSILLLNDKNVKETQIGEYEVFIQFYPMHKLNSQRRAFSLPPDPSTVSFPILIVYANDLGWRIDLYQCWFPRPSQALHWTDGKLNRELLGHTVCQRDCSQAGGCWPIFWHPVSGFMV